MLRFIRPAVSASLPVAAQARRLFSRSRITQESAEQQQFMRNEIQLSRNVLADNKSCGNRLKVKVKSLPGGNFDQKTSLSLNRL